MKKLLILIAIVLFIEPTGKAQNFGFENWVNVPFSTTVQDPQYWASFNVIYALGLGMNQTVFKETTAPYAGSASVKVVTDVLPGSVQVPNPFNPSENMDTVGLLGLGVTQFSSPYVKYGSAYTGRPASLTFACKYTPNGNDSAFILSYLTKWNVNHRDTIASGAYRTGAATSNYAMQSLNLTYNSAFNSVLPDTQMVFISSSIFRGNGAKVGSAFYIDDLNWSGWNSVAETAANSTSISYFPNPSNNYIWIKSSTMANNVQMIDISGKLIGTYQLSNNEVKISTNELPEGIYFFTVLKDKEILNRGKVQVLH
jgi:hypothetical protein